MQFGMSQSVTRKEDVRFLTGTGRYLDDIAIEGTLRAYILRSPTAHARITRLDVSAARAALGVKLIYVFEDVRDRLAPLTCRMPLTQANGDPLPPVERPHLADGVVRFVGQPIAFIAAETLEQARDAAELIEFEFEELPAVVDARAALAPGAPLLHDVAPGNQCYDWAIGDADATQRAFDTAAHVVKTSVVNQRLIVVAMEPRGILIRYGDDDRWEAWVGSQGAHPMRGGIAGSLKVAPERLRVHAPDIGGGFGMKIMQHEEYALCALAAKDLGAPVKWVGDRSESFLSDAQARDLQTEIEGAFDAEGRILALRSTSWSNAGAYFSSAGPVIHTIFSGNLIGGVYRVPAIHVRVYGALTNTTPTDAYRGAGRPEVIYCTERLMDEAARRIDVDPVALRRLNLLQPEEMPTTSPGGMAFDSLDPDPIIDLALAEADYEGFDARAAASARDGNARGRAAVYYMERTGGGPDENAEVEIGADGAAVIRVGTQSTGQGHETAWAQILTQNLGLDWDAIALAPGDSDALPLGGGTGGSRSLIMASRTIALASDDIVRKLSPAAAEELEVAEADVEFSAADGAFRVAGTDRAVALTAVTRKVGGVTGFGSVDTRENTFPNGCH
ncbi:MAG: xanthine dehydrogenase family protein molybdopterin-binding subunit, partial [Pseudomonadota bacterium]